MNVISMNGKKRLAEGALKLASQIYREFSITLDPGIEFGVVFDQAFWANFGDRLASGDLIRVRTHDNLVDCYVTVITAQRGGAVVDLWPRLPQEYEDDGELADSSRLKVVPFVKGKPAIRVDFQPGTLWRVIGLDGSMIARDIKLEEDAIHVMDGYLKSLRMVMPSPEEIVSEAKAYEEAEAVKHAARTGHAHAQ